MKFNIIGGNDVSLHRQISSIKGDSSERLFVGIGGMHGNEPAGVRALDAVFRQVEPHFFACSGTLVALTGNISALSSNVRHLDEDLNRIWLPERIDRLREKPQSLYATIEEREAAELLSSIESLLQNNYKEIVFVDLHTTSASNGLFVIGSEIVSDFPPIFRLGIPVVFGIGSRLDGTFMNFFAGKGYTSFSVEGGGHTDPDSVDNLQDILWLLLSQSGFIDENKFPQVRDAGQRLTKKTEHLPKTLEVFYKYSIVQGSRFNMHPGYRNFSLIRKDEILGQIDGTEVRSPDDGYLLMPLYQPAGTEGFFLAR